MLEILALHYKRSSTVFAGWISFKPGLIDVSCPSLDQIYICFQPGLHSLNRCDYSSLYERVGLTVKVKMMNSVKALDYLEMQFQLTKTSYSCLRSLLCIQCKTPSVSEARYASEIITIQTAATYTICS